MADLTTWARPTLERLATELQADNLRLREENEALQAERREALAAWRAEVCRVGLDQQKHGGTAP